MDDHAYDIEEEKMGLVVAACVVTALCVAGFVPSNFCGESSII